MKIVLVEDDADLRYLLKLSLELSGYEVIEAATGEEALLFAAGGDIAGMILDIRLPGIDGFEVIRRLGVGDRFPILAMSAHASQEDADLAVQMGCSSYLMKPFTPKQLVSLVAEHVQPTGRWN